MQSRYRPAQGTLPGFEPDISAIVAKTTQLVVKQTIDIPRIIVMPVEEVKSGFKPFKLELATLKYQAPSEELWIQHLRTSERETISLGRGGIEEQRLEDYVVGGLVDFDDVSYDDQAELLYDLATQTVSHFKGYLSEDDTRKVLRCYQKPIAEFIHVQMLKHYWEDEVDYEVTVTKGFTELRQSAYTASATEAARDFRQAPPDKNNIVKYLFGGFERCLYATQKFQADTERRFAMILDREALKWFRPAEKQFQMFYKSGIDQKEYQPDFVAESETAIYMVETKAANAMNDAEVLAKRDAGVKWCQHATEHAASYQGKPWQYLLIPHDVIAENRSLAGLAQQYCCS